MPALHTPDPALIRKLSRFMDLTDHERADLRRLAEPVHTAAAREELTRQGHKAGTAVLLHTGWAIRHRTLRDGRRQIIDFIVPGDLCDPSSFVTRRPNFTITAITPVTYTPVAAGDVLALLARSSRLGAFFWWLEAQEESFLRAHLVALGRLRARERIAYLIWELWIRLRAVGLATADAFELPATQDVIADATGLSHVHVSRTLKQLQRDGIIRRAEHLYRITDTQRLLAIAQVDGEPGGHRLPPKLQGLLRKA